MAESGTKNRVIKVTRNKDFFFFGGEGLMMSEWSEKPATVNDTMNSVTQKCFVSCRFFPGVYSACTEMYSINAFFFFYELVHGDGDGIGI